MPTPTTPAPAGLSPAVEALVLTRVATARDFQAYDRSKAGAAAASLRGLQGTYGPQANLLHMALYVGAINETEFLAELGKRLALLAK